MYHGRQRSDCSFECYHVRMANVQRTSLAFDEHDLARFWANVAQGAVNECWPWQGRRNNSGYGKFWAKGVTTGAHKFAYIATYGPIRPGDVIDHECHHHQDCDIATCQHKLCCNPHHLRAKSQSDNIRASDTHLAAKNARKTHCPAGHSYAEHGFRNNRGQRQCRVCVNGRRRQAYAQGKYHY